MISLAEARRIALAAQGFAQARPRRVTVRHLEATVRRIAPLQLDFVNVLVPAHFLIPYSRLGPYRRETLHSLLYEHGKFTEQWAHEAAVIPVETWPLLRHRMAEHRVRPYGMEPMLRRHSAYARRVLEVIREAGAKAAHELPAPPKAAALFEGTWIGTFQRAVLEAHFGRGLLASANRLPNFARSYDLAERLIPAEFHGFVPDREQAEERLIEMAARAHGIATIHDLADYYRLDLTVAKRAAARLVQEKRLEETAVEGWKDRAYLAPGAERPKRIEAAALLSPFDPVVWFRPRAARLFGFDYRIEIYTPAAKRKFGYYVLPFLQGDRLTARVDLKADRVSGTLRVLAAYGEEGVRPDAIVKPLLDELETLAGWLGLRAIDVERKGDLAIRLCTSR